MYNTSVQYCGHTGRLAQVGLALLTLVFVCLASSAAGAHMPLASGQHPIIDRWEFEKIPLPTEYARQALDTEAAMSLAIDAQDRAHMILGETSALYAFRDEHGWSFQALGRREAPTLRLDAEGRPHLAYYADGRIHYAVLETGQWLEEHAVAAAVPANGLALDEKGHPHIAYIRPDSGKRSPGGVAYAWSDGVTWHDTVVTPGRASENVGLALDNNGNPTLIYGPAYTYRILAAVPGPNQTWQETTVIEPDTGDFEFRWVSDSLQVSSDSDGNTLFGHTYGERFLVKPSDTWTYWAELDRLTPDGVVEGLSGWGFGEVSNMQAIHGPGLSGTVFYVVNAADGLRFKDVTELGSMDQYLPGLRAADIAVGPDGQPRMVASGPGGAFLYGWRHQVALTNQAFLPVTGNHWIGDWIADDPPGVTRLVTIGPNPAGDIVSFPVVSNNGRWIAFENSRETYVTPVAAIKDRATRHSRCISVDQEGNCRLHAYSLSMSADGRLVVFRSEASLLPEDTEDDNDIYLYDVTADELELISYMPDLVATQYWVYRGVEISGDGRTIAFVTDREQGHGIAVYDRETRQIDNLFPDPATDPLAERPGYLSLSDNGRYVAFTLSADLPIIGDDNGHGDIFIYDCQTDVVELVSVHTDGTQADGPSLESRISGNGRYVVFTTEAGNLSPADNNGATDIYRHDRHTGETSWVSRNLTWEGAHSYAPDISSDGQLIVFESYANFGNAADGNGYNDVYLVDGEHEPELLSVTLAGIAGNRGSGAPAISPNGNFVVFKSEVKDLVGVRPLGRTNIFIRRVR